MNIFGNLRVKRLIASLNRSNQHEHRQAIEDLVKIGSPVVQPLLDALHNPYTSTESVVEVLGRLGDPRAIEPLFTDLVISLSGALGGDAIEKKRVDIFTVGLVRLGEPARKYAGDIKALGDSVDNKLMLRAAELLLVRFEQTEEDEQLASNKWRNGPECGNCGKTTLLISETQVSKLLMDGGVSDEDRMLAPKTAYRCKECQQVSCLECAFKTGKSLNVMVPACPKCHSTQITTIA